LTKEVSKSKDIKKDTIEKSRDTLLPKTCLDYTLPSIKGQGEWKCDTRQVEFGTTCYPHCVRGDMVPDLMVTEVCTPEGWFPNMATVEDYPQCVLAPCLNLQNETIAHGEWHCKPKRDPRRWTNTHEGTVCSLTCEGNYSPEHGHETTVCTSSGWHPPTTAFGCEICAKPRDPENGWWECNKVHHTLAQVCQFQCKDGFIRKGKHMVECLEDTPADDKDAVIQQWIPDPEDVFCQPNLKSGQFSSAGLLIGDRVTQITQHINKSCSAPKPVEFGSWELNEERNISTLICREGFKSEGSILCHCIDGTWCCGTKDVSQGCVPTCVELPPMVEGGSWDCGSDSPYTRCHLKCEERKRFGEGWALCGLGGVWTMDGAQCSLTNLTSQEKKKYKDSKLLILNI